MNIGEAIKEMRLGILDNKITDVMQFRDIPGEQRQAVPFVILENARRKWQK